MGWQNPVPDGSWTRGFAPSLLNPNPDGPFYADGPLRRAHDANNGPNGNGQGPFTGSDFYPHFHAALDIAAQEGTRILAPESGTVLDAQFGVPGSWANGGGWFVRVLVNPTCMYLIAHCSVLHVRAGDHILRGEHIADVGHTGVATGNHAHFWARLGPTPYYDPDAFYYNPALLLPGGPLFGDVRFAPTVDELPDTSFDPHRADGDPAPMRFRSELDARGHAIRRTVKEHKPIRKGVTVDSGTWKAFPKRRTLSFIGRIPKEDLPAGERPFGDVLICPVYVSGGHVLGYVKQVDLAGN